MAAGIEMEIKGSHKWPQGIMGEWSDIVDNGFIICQLHQHILVRFHYYGEYPVSEVSAE